MATTRRLQQYGRPYQPKHSPSYILFQMHVYISALVWKNLVSHIMVKINFDQFLDLLGFVHIGSNCSKISTTFQDFGLEEPVSRIIFFI